MRLPPPPLITIELAALNRVSRNFGDDGTVISRPKRLKKQFVKSFSEFEAAISAIPSNVQLSHERPAHVITPEKLEYFPQSNCPGREISVVQAIPVRTIPQFAVKPGARTN
jgi:hypothetical protein